MSVNYAAGLSDYPNRGKCGQKEFLDVDSEFTAKVDQLVERLRMCECCVVLTGAGISTSAGIPDFRGPKGVWTLDDRGEKPDFATTFSEVQPTKAHLALVSLEKAGYIKYLVTQNVDGIHLRSGFPRDRMAILHGDMFIEKCDKCNHQFITKDCVPTMAQKRTGKKCSKISKRGNPCRGYLRDTILDWEDNLPDEDLSQAQEYSRRADLFLVLGSSLQIIPAGNLPLASKKNGGIFVSVNLQKTKHHSNTDIVIHSHIDKVMERVCTELNVAIDTYSGPRIVLHSIHSTNKINLKTSLFLSVKQEIGDMKCEKESECHKRSADELEDSLTKVKCIKSDNLS